MAVHDKPKRLVERLWQVDRTGSRSCLAAGFGISSVEPSDSATREFVN
jgi:hypothetical protein